MITLHIEPRPIPAAKYKEFRRVVFKSRYYGVLQGAPKDKLIGLAEDLDLTAAQAISMHHLLVKEKIVAGTPRINAIIAHIAREYGSRVSILDLAHKYDYPPLNLLRSIFLRLGYSAREIYDVFAGTQDPATKFDGRDLSEFIIAAANDADTVINQKDAQVRAEINEQLFVNYLRDKGCDLSTQADLIAKQVATHGRPTLTPDVLFNSPVMINGAVINWIDFKDYVGTRISFIWQGNKKQVDKYTAAYGPGLLCYRLGFVDDIGLPAIDCLGLDVPFAKSPSE